MQAMQQLQLQLLEFCTIYLELCVLCVCVSHVEQRKLEASVWKRRTLSLPSGNVAHLFSFFIFFFLHFSVLPIRPYGAAAGA